MNLLLFLNVLAEYLRYIDLNRYTFLVKFLMGSGLSQCTCSLTGSSFISLFKSLMKRGFLHLKKIDGACFELLGVGIQASFSKAATISDN